MALSADIRIEADDAPAGLFALLLRDRFALVSAAFLVLMLTSALIGPTFLSEPANAMNLRLRNLPPFSLSHGLLFVLGGDTLGRSILARIIIASRDTIAVSGGAVLLSAVVGTALGLVAGLGPRWLEAILMRLADVLMSFPSLLLALVVLYVLGPSVPNVVLVLGLTRIPLYLRAVRAETLEIRERMFVLSARSMAASRWRIVRYHILPVLKPTLTTLATLDFAAVMLTESSLTFLGLGVQPPGVTWGMMVSQGQSYLVSAWWISFWPGLAIILTTLSLSLLGNFFRIAGDPQQVWRLQART